MKINPPLRIPYILSIIWNLIILIIHYNLKKSPLVQWFHTIYWSVVSFLSQLSLQSDYTLLFSKKFHPPVQVQTFHQSAVIWFYWLYTIILRNLSLLSDSMQSIDKLFRLHQTCSYNQTLHDHFIEFLASLCESMHYSIICNLILLILHSYFEKYIIFEWLHQIYWSAISFSSDFSLQSYSILSF